MSAKSFSLEKHYNDGKHLKKIKSKNVSHIIFLEKHNNYGKHLGTDCTFKILDIQVLISIKKQNVSYIF